MKIATVALLTLLGLVAACDETPQAKEERRLKALQAEILENQKRVERAEAELKLQDAKREDFRNRIRNATDSQLRQLYYDCEAEVRDDLRQKNQKSGKYHYDVFFPHYGASELQTITTAATAMGMKLGRPSTVLEQSDFEERRIKRLREHPISQIVVIVESASESFSGPKRWVAEYSCALDGLRVTSVARQQFHFLD